MFKFIKKILQKKTSTPIVCKDVGSKEDVNSFHSELVSECVAIILRKKALDNIKKYSAYNFDYLACSGSDLINKWGEHEKIIKNSLETFNIFELERIFFEIRSTKLKGKYTIKSFIDYICELKSEGYKSGDIINIIKY